MEYENSQASSKHLTSLLVNKQSTAAFLVTQQQHGVFCLPLSPSPCPFLCSPPAAPIAGKHSRGQWQQPCLFQAECISQASRGLFSCPWVPQHATGKMQEFRDCWVLSCCSFLSEGNWRASTAFRNKRKYFSVGNAFLTPQLLSKMGKKKKKGDETVPVEREKFLFIFLKRQNCFTTSNSLHHTEKTLHLGIMLLEVPILTLFFIVHYHY